MDQALDRIKSSGAGPAQGADPTLPSGAESRSYTKENLSHRATGHQIEANNRDANIAANIADRAGYIDVLDANGQDGLASVLGYDIENGGAEGDALSGATGHDTLFGSAADDNILGADDRTPQDAVAPVDRTRLLPAGFTRDLMANMQGLLANDELDFSPSHIGRAPQQRRFARA